jgi:carbonic anhydrase
MIPANKALQRLREGNQRFVSWFRNKEASLTLPRQVDLEKGQNPFAIVLGCSDSRVPAEMVFNQGLGDLFVIRVAGNIAAPSQIGSVEFAAANFGVRLVVVLGHTQCGAIQATINALQRGEDKLSDSLLSIVDRVRPSIESLAQSDPDQDIETLAINAIRANVRASVNHLRSHSEILQLLIENDELVVIGAEFSLKTGEVEFFED